MRREYLINLLDDSERATENMNFSKGELQCYKKVENFVTSNLNFLVKRHLRCPQGFF